MNDANCRAGVLIHTCAGLSELEYAWGDLQEALGYSRGPGCAVIRQELTLLRVSE